MSKVKQIYNFLKKQDLLKNSSKYWWPNAGSFEVVLGAILTQNTSWNNVEKSLKNLNCLTLYDFLEIKELEDKIRPSGFYKKKAIYLTLLVKNIKKEFNSFENFCKNVDRNWLLKQKGIGKETADSILCYGCFRDVFVVDNYTKRLFKKFGIEFKEYDLYQNIVYEFVKTQNIKDLNLFFARFHAMIVEYFKR